MGDKRMEDGTVFMIKQETVTPGTLNGKGTTNEDPTYFFSHIYA
jgi:hypothetical protein